MSFENAFDKVELLFMLKYLEFYNFGNNFMKWINYYIEIYNHVFQKSFQVFQSQSRYQTRMSNVCHIIYFSIRKLSHPLKIE